MNRSHIYAAFCIHWDHHPVAETQHYGAGTEADQIRRYLRAVQPDVTQYHALGYAGYASYPSDIAPAVPGLVGDPLRVWSQVCVDENIPLGCDVATFNCLSPLSIPKWRCVNRAGTLSEEAYCPNGPFTEEFLIPLLFEVIERYHPVHFWLDGVSSPANRKDYCCCTHCQERFHQHYGHRMPVNPSVADWIELQEFAEHSLDSAVSRIGRTIKLHNSNILLACNYLYFFKDARKPMPEVDWLSWDALNTSNLHRASFESTYVSTAGRPADMMIYDQGIIRRQPAMLRRPRTLAQLKTEAGTILAHGARVNLWHDLCPDGSLPASKAGIAQQVAEFVRQRQAWCIDNESAAEVAVLVSRLDHYLHPEEQDVNARAVQQLLQEAHIPCDVVHDDVLLNRLVQYHLVILPETRALNLDTAQWLRQYALDGGSILLVAAEASGADTHWQETLLGEGNRLLKSGKSGGCANMRDKQIEIDHPRFTLSGNWRCVIPYDDDETPWLAELVAGDGSILVITGQAVSEYADTHWPPLRDLIASAARTGIGHSPLIEMPGRPGIELVANKRGGDLFVHLVNLTPGISFGASNDVFYDEAPTYHNITLTIRPPRMPRSIVLLPAEQDLMAAVESSECQDPEGHCMLKITIPELSHHLAIRLAGALDNSINGV